MDCFDGGTGDGHKQNNGFNSSSSSYSQDNSQTVTVTVSYSKGFGSGQSTILASAHDGGSSLTYTGHHFECGF